MSGHDETLSNAKLRWGIWVLTLGQIDIEDLMQTMQTMLIPHDIDPFWLDDDSSGPQSPTIAGSGQENRATGTSLPNSNDQKGRDPEEGILIPVETGNTGEKLKDEVETLSLGTGDKTGSGSDRTEIIKEEKKEIRIEEKDEIGNPDLEEKEKYVFESSMIRYNFRLNYYRKLANKILPLFAIEGKADEAEKLLDRFYVVANGLTKLLEVSSLASLQKRAAKLEQGFSIMTELEKTVKELGGTPKLAPFDQKDPDTWEPCAVRYKTNAVERFVGDYYDAPDLELRRTFQAGDRHQGGTPVTLNTPMHDHASIDSQGISFKFLKYDPDNKQDRRVELYVYDFAESRVSGKNTYNWKYGTKSSGPSDAE